MKIDKVSHPIPVGFMGRKRSTDFKNTTLETWKREIPAELYRINKAEQSIIIDEKVKFNYGGLDDQESINKFNSAELAFLAIDQAEETNRDDISVLEGSLRLKFNGITPPYKVFYTANPRNCWLKQDFVKGGRPNAIFIKALPSDNPHLPENYEDRLKSAFGYNGSLLQAYLYGEWDVFEGMYFEEFNRDLHVYRPNDIKILPEWPKFRSADWGYSSPMAVYWHAVGPDQHVYTYREFYRTHQLDVDASREVKKLTGDEPINYTVGDPQSFPVEIPHYKFGKIMSVKRSEVWAENGVPIIMGDSKRIPGWSRMREYLRIRDYMGAKSSWWHISSECPNLIDEITTAIFDKNKIEDISADSVDHGLEACRLGLMSRPPLWRESEKPISHLEAAFAQMEREEEAFSKQIGAL